MPRVRISESSDESDSDVPLSKIRAQSNASDDTRPSPAPPHPDPTSNADNRQDTHRTRGTFETTRPQKSPLNAGLHSEQSDDDIPLDRFQGILNGKRDAESGESEDDVPLERMVQARVQGGEDEDSDFEAAGGSVRRFSRLSKSRRGRRARAGAVLRASEAEEEEEGEEEKGDNDDDDDDDDMPLARKVSELGRGGAKGRGGVKREKGVGNGSGAARKVKVERRRERVVVKEEGDVKRVRKRERVLVKEEGVVKKVKKRERVLVKEEGVVKKARVGKGKAEGKADGVKKKKKGEGEEVVRKFEKLGQKKETPPENDPSRLFYESMYREKMKLGRRSSLAEIWMLRHGLLEEREAKQVMQRVIHEKVKLAGR